MSLPDMPSATQWTTENPKRHAALLDDERKVESGYPMLSSKVKSVMECPKCCGLGWSKRGESPKSWQPSWPWPRYEG